jgi:hypothetical protein
MSPEPSVEPAARGSRRRGYVVELAVASGIVATLVALLIPAVLDARRSAQRAQDT